VQGVDLARSQPVEHAVGQHRGGAGERLLGRLEHEHHGAGQAVPQPGQDLGGAHPDGGVDVVAAQVQRLGPAAELGGRRHGVDVGPVGDRTAPVGAAQDPDHTVAAHPRGDLQTGRPEPGRHRCGRSPLLAGRLGMLVEVAPERDETVVEARRMRVDLTLVDPDGRRRRRRGRDQRRGSGGGTAQNDSPTDHAHEPVGPAAGTH
jgi:hypothetical protein